VKAGTIALLIFINFVSPDILPSLCGKSTIPSDLEGKQMIINPAYANTKEASVPIKLKVKVGDGKMQRRAYGEKHFSLVINKLKKEVGPVAVTSSSIKKRIDALNDFIPSKKQRQSRSNEENQKIIAEVHLTSHLFPSRCRLPIDRLCM
jgi:hypothetical protein